MSEGYECLTEEQARRLRWMERSVEVYQNEMTEEDKQRLHAFEGEHLGDGVKGTSDWPGWEKYIGKPPWKEGRDPSSDDR